MRTLFIVISLLIPLLPATAQKKKATPPPTVEEQMAQYRFAEAATRLEADIALLKRRRQDVTAQTRTLGQCRTLQLAVEAAQQVVFTDSVVVPLAEMLHNLPLGSESGTVTTWARAFGGTDTLGCTAYQSQLGNLTVFASPSTGTPRLCQRWIEGAGWTPETPLRGLNETDSCQNYPFMLSDGATLYFGAVNPSGLGGYDIYFSRLDAESGTFSQPENLGMPFNSPANDYMMCIDEFNQLGYLVSDRYQPAGQVCIYTFIPPTVRTGLADLGTPADRLRRLAAIASIAESQEGQDAVVTAARGRSNEAMQQHSARRPDATDSTRWRPLVLAGDKLAKQLSDVPAALRQKAVEWQQAMQEVEEATLQLETARQLYSTATGDQKTRLRTQLLTMEAALQQAMMCKTALEKEIREK